MDSKVWWKSRTVWVNVLMIVGAVVAIPGLGLPSETAATIVAVVNVLLRTITKEPLTLSRRKKRESR